MADRNVRPTGEKEGRKAGSYGEIFGVCFSLMIETLEGNIGEIWFHHDVVNDVLYLRLQSKRDAACLGEETDEGVILMRDQKTEKTVGITIVNWWKRFGRGSLPDSMKEIRRKVRPWAKRIMT